MRLTCSCGRALRHILQSRGLPYSTATTAARLLLLLVAARHSRWCPSVLQSLCCQVSSSELPWSVHPSALAAAVVSLIRHGWPPSLLLAYDEAWAVVQQASVLMAGSTGNRVNMDILAWCVLTRTMFDCFCAPPALIQCVQCLNPQVLCWKLYGMSCERSMCQRTAVSLHMHNWQASGATGASISCLVIHTTMHTFVFARCVIPCGQVRGSQPR